MSFLSLNHQFFAGSGDYGEVGKDDVGAVERIRKVGKSQGHYLVNIWYHFLPSRLDITQICFSGLAGTPSVSPILSTCLCVEVVQRSWNSYISTRPPVSR